MSAAGTPDPAQIFDRALVRWRRERARDRGGKADFLFAEVALRLADRLADVRRAFSVGVELGGRAGHLASAVRATGRVESLFVAEPSARLAKLLDGQSFVADEEILPLAPGSLDLVISSLALHWVNDLPGSLAQIRQALRPDGLFLAALFGGETLRELRETLMEAELAVTGGASPRVSPMADLRDAAGLLQRAGFALPVADRDLITIAYSSPLALLRDLSQMGESNAARLRSRHPLSRAVLAEMLRLYQERYAMPDGRVRASFEVLYLSGWSPAATQQKPLRPGQARNRLSDVLGAVEHSVGDLAVQSKLPHVDPKQE